MDISGDKVILRAAGEQDRRMFTSLIQDSEIIKVTGGYAGPASLEQQMDWLCSPPDSARELRRVIAEKEHPEHALGIITLSHMDPGKGSAEIYIKLESSVRRKGYGQDAVSVLVSYGFCRLQLSCIYSRILEDNLPSRRLFEACGFRLEDRYKGREYEDGRRQTICFYSIGKCVL